MHRFRKMEFTRNRQADASTCFVTGHDLSRAEQQLARFWALAPAKLKQRKISYFPAFGIRAISAVFKTKSAEKFFTNFSNKTHFTYSKSRNYNEKPTQFHFSVLPVSHQNKGHWLQLSQGTLPSTSSGCPRSPGFGDLGYHQCRFHH